jgi:hypothetical protein
VELWFVTRYQGVEPRISLVDPGNSALRLAARSG